MKILGISFGHDLGYTFIKNNKIEIILEYERYIKRKWYKIRYDGKDPSRIKRLLSTIKLITNEDKFDEIYIATTCKVVEDTTKNLLKDCDIKYGKIERADHRTCHNLSSYMVNEGNDGLCISMDGSGDGTFNAELYDNTNYIELDREWNYSFGYFYLSAARHAMKILNISESEETISGKFMGLTAYGKRNNEIYEKLTKVFVDLFLKSRKCNSDLLDLFKKLIDRQISNIITEDNLKDFSYTFQQVWIEQILNYIEKFKDHSDRLYVSGGCFLNCHLNRELIETGWFDKIYFTPVTDDSGQSLGAALHGCTEKVEFTPFIGTHSFDNNIYDGGIDYTAEDIARHVYANRIVGIFRDRMEVGPRALGNRSILANPMTINMKKILNERVKHREWFRPYGAIVKKDYLNKYYHMINETSFPYMNITLYNKTDLFPSVTHVDNTTRIQTVTEDDDLIYEILSEFEKLTGHPVLINTSFNVQGKPIINYYEDAYEMFSKGELDILILEDKLYK